jgi:hypothetical protein
MSLCVVEQSPGRPLSGTVPRVRSTRTGRAAWPKVRTMRSSGVGLRRMRTASRSAANAAAPCEARVDPAAARRGTRPLTRSSSGSDRSTPEGLSRKLLDVFAGHRTATFISVAARGRSAGRALRAGRDVSAVRPARPAQNASRSWPSPPQRVGIFGRQIGPAPAWS